MYSYDRATPGRRIVAFAFDTPEQREEYLKEHPKADPSKHTVKQEAPEKGKAKPPPKPKARPAPAPEEAQQPKPSQAEKPAKPSESEWEAPEGEPDKKDIHPPERKVIEGLKGVSSAAMAALKKAPASVQKFFQDEGHRKKVLSGLGSALQKAPRKIADAMIHGVKEEVHEFKEAGEGIAAAWNGKPMSTHQKKALKTVAIHMGITAAAAALTTTGVVASLGFAAKAFAKHIAMKSAHKVLGQAHTAEELHHIGHGLMELMSKFAADGKKPQPQPDPEKLMAALVLKAVQDEIASFDDDALRAVLEGASGQKAPKVKTAAGPRRGPELAALCEQAGTIHKNLRAWIREFPLVLNLAKREAVGLESGLVWQDQFVRWWRDLDAPMAALESINEGVDDIYLRSGGHVLGALATLANTTKDATSDRLVPRKAQLEYAFGDVQFRDHPEQKSHIAYKIDRLEEWAGAFEKWTEDSIVLLKNNARKAKRLV